jgi:Protein of unknown function (DUF1566)/S-layer homology domain
MNKIKFPASIAVLLLICTLFATNAIYAASFTDIESHKNETAIEYITEAGIVEGYSDGTYRPNALINRAELLKIILEANDIDTTDGLSNCFPDVGTQWFAKYVCKAKEIEVVGGYPDGTFKPGNNVNFVEALKIVERSYGATITEGNPWYQGYIDEAKAKNLIPTDINSNSALITRGQMADMITRQLTYEDGTQEEVTETTTVTGTGMVDTGQVNCYDNSGSFTCPSNGSSYFGQDAQYEGLQPSYTDNGDDTVIDNVTGLMWSQGVDTNKVSLAEAEQIASAMTLGGHTDWRVPNIKEMYSLIDFNGYTGASQDMTSVPSNAVPFIDTDYFDFEWGLIDQGERYIDAQWLTTSKYVSTTMNGAETLFGVNFADGRIKGYGYTMPNRPGAEKKFYVRYVRGNSYGDNDFVDNGNETITDGDTGLIWQKDDSEVGMNWEDSLAYCENLALAGSDEWRLPNSKELQYIVDYSRSPATTNSPAIDPIFNTSSITDEKGDTNYPYFWTSTTHLDGPQPGTNAAYVAFGEALGYMNGEWIDVHGAGAQRSDPKTGDYTDYPDGHGPQGDSIRIENHVRCVSN